jgi:transposase-like protein
MSSKRPDNSDLVALIKKQHGNMSRCARALGVGRTTFWRWVDGDPVLRAAVEEETETIVDLGEDNIYRALKAHNLTATIFVLKTLGKKRGWVERTEIISVEKRRLADAIDDVQTSIQERLEAFPDESAEQFRAWLDQRLNWASEDYGVERGTVAAHVTMTLSPESEGLFVETETETTQ